MPIKNIDLSFLSQGFDVLELPSKGLLYTKDNPLSSGKINVRAWVTAEERQLNKINSNNVYPILRRLLENSIEGNIDITQMTLGDFFYTMYWVRQLTYGSAYMTTVKCPHCETEVSTTIDIFECETVFLESNPEPIQIELKKSGIKLKLRLPRFMDILKSTESTFAGSKKFGITIDPELYRTGLSILEMELPNEDKDVLTAEDNFEQIIKILPKLHPIDNIIIKKAIDKYDHGYVGTVITKCENCGNPIEQVPVLNYQFFRPSDI